MGQYWQIVNVDNGEIWRDEDGKLGEFFWHGGIDYLPFMLTRPMWAEPYEEFATWTQLRRRNRRVIPAFVFAKPGQVGLLELPVELIRAIFDAIPDLVDAISLCLATQRIGLIGERRVHKLLIESAAPWAGKRIVCLGGYTRDHDFPPSLQGHFNRIGIDGAKAALRARYPHIGDDEYDRAWYRGMISETYSSCTDPINLLDLVRLYPDDALKPSEKKRFYGQFIGKLIRSFKQLGGDWPPTKTKALCNLSRGEYFRERAVVELFARRKSTVSRYAWKPVLHLAEYRSD